MPGRSAASGSGSPNRTVTGTTPAHLSVAQSCGSSDGSPVRILTEASASGSARAEVAASSFLVGWRT